MDEFHSGDEMSFNPDETTVTIKECIDSIIGGVDYNINLVNKWTASVVELSLTQLVKQGKPFKYIVTCAVMQKSGAGLHTANSCYWDTASDGKMHAWMKLISAVASQQEDSNPSCSRVLSVFVWVTTGFSGFLPPSKDVFRAITPVRPLTKVLAWT
ncbi:dynein light chain Tctex-type 3-like [Aplochiton taeniatus]